MREDLFSLLILIVIVIMFYYFYGLLGRVVTAFEKWVDNARGNEIHSTSRLFSPTASPINQERSENKATEIRIKELPPEVVAPHLRRPPKTSGFGGGGGSDGN